MKSYYIQVKGLVRGLCDKYMTLCISTAVTLKLKTTLSPDFSLVNSCDSLASCFGYFVFSIHLNYVISLMLTTLDKQL